MNLYAYVRGDPVNLKDPTGFEGKDIVVCGGVWINGECHSHAFAERLIAQLFGGGVGMGTYVNNGRNMLIPLGPDAIEVFKTCPSTQFKVTGVGPSQAPGETALTHIKREDLPPGAVAIKPRNFGTSQRPDGSYSKSLSGIRFFVNWGTANRPGNAPQVPAGLPTQGPYSAHDVISPESVRDAPGNQIDLYGFTDQAEAYASTREVTVIPVVPVNGDGVTCPP
jgi:hypothetical protein